MNHLLQKEKKNKESIKSFIESNGLLKAIEMFDSIDNVAKLVESTPLDLVIDYFQPPYVDHDKLIFETGKEFSIIDFPIRSGTYDFNFKIHSLNSDNNFWNFDIDIIEGGTVEIDGEERELWDSDLWNEDYWWEIQNEINGILYEILWLFAPESLRDIGVGFNLE